MQSDLKNVAVDSIVLITGGFDPIHRGHLSYIDASKKLGSKLIVGVNSDEWLTRKKGRSFMPIDERVAILSALGSVDEVITFDDSDDSGKEAILKIRSVYPDSHIIYANGGDRTKTNIPEMDLNDPLVSFVFGVGGEDKKNSSSWILQEWKSPKTLRDWGYYRVLHEDTHQVKVKELTVEPGKKLSMQRHQSRAEFWFVSEGIATVYNLNVCQTHSEPLGTFSKFNSTWIPKTSWHQLCNETTEPLRIIEIQYGENCIEEDIERMAI
jgi:cytidyltransferase-like protein